MTRLSNAQRLGLEVLFEQTLPPPPVDYLKWAKENIVFSDRITQFPGPYNEALFPFFSEILKALTPDDPCRMVTISKSAQVGGTVLANIFTLGTMDMDPCDFLYVHPTEENASRWSKQKLMPLLRETTSLAALFPEKSRDGSNSIHYKERADGRGAIQAAGANSPSGLSMISPRKQVQDDLSKWQNNEAGDPESQAESRSKAFIAAKILKISTPLIAPGCRISSNFERGSQEYYHVPCPHCQHMHPLEWEHMRDHIDADHPERACFYCPKCGSEIREHHRAWMVDPANGAKWVAKYPERARYHRSFHIWVPQYRSGGEVTIDAALSIALEAINATCQGRIAEVGGIYQMFVGAPDVPVVHFTDDDILSTEEQSFTPFFGLADTINGIIATYPSPADGWVIKTAPPIHRTDLEARHGNRRLMASVELNFVPYAEQVQRLMSSALLEGQRARRHTIVLPPRFWAYATPGTILSWTSKRNGYVNKLMRVGGAADRANLDVLVDLTEVDPADYDWDSGADFKPPVDGAIGTMRPQPQPIIDFSAIPSVGKDANGNDRRPAILLQWDGNKTAIDLVRFEVRQAWDLVTCYTGRTEEVVRGALLIAPFMLQANSEYQVFQLG